VESVKLIFYKLAPNGAHRWHDDPGECRTWVVLMDEADGAVWNGVSSPATDTPQQTQTLDKVLEDLGEQVAP
jgi:hypothetical protein